MILITYYNNDRIGYRIIGTAKSADEAADILERQAIFDRNDFMAKMNNHGIFVTPAGYMIMDTTRTVDIVNKNYYQLGLPYSTDLTQVSSFQAFAKSYIRNLKLKQINL